MGYRLFEIEVLTTGESHNDFPLSEFEKQQKRFAAMSSDYGSGAMYILVIAEEEEFDVLRAPLFDENERVLCYPGDCGPRLHEEAAANVERWKHILEGE